MARVFYILDNNKPILVTKPFFRLSENDEVMCSTHKYGCETKLRHRRKCEYVTISYGNDLLFSCGDVLYQKIKASLKLLRCIGVYPIDTGYVKTKRYEHTYSLVGPGLTWWRYLASELQRLKRLAKKYKNHTFVISTISPDQRTHPDIAEESSSTSI
jgi:hypothetical protein